MVDPSDAPPDDDPVRHLSRVLAAAGFDLTQAFDAAAFNREASGSFRLEAFGRDSALAVIVGHTRRVWPPFVRRYREGAMLQASEHPFDQYTEQMVLGALAPLPLRYRAYFGHHRQPERVPLQRLAAAAGLAELSPSHLNIHPVHGPWIGLRAAIVFDRAAHAPRPALRSLCNPCHKPCVLALHEALGVSSAEPEPRFQAWLRVRDSCPVGRPSRYGNAQLRYHYLQDRSVLDR